MGRIFVRNLEKTVLERLKAHAALERPSLEAIVRKILTDLPKPSKAEVSSEIDHNRLHQSKNAADSTDLVHAWRDDKEASAE